MRAVIALLLLVSASYAHDGHNNNNPPPAAIQNGKLKAPDNVVYLDAGAEVEWMGQKLKRKITGKNQLVYQFNGEPVSISTLATDQDKYLTLKVSGGEALKAFNFDHAGDLHDPIEVTAPDFANEIVIQKDKDLRLQWKPDSSASMIKVIIETYSTEGKLTGRLTISTNDDGDFSVPSQYLNQLPNDSGKIAIKRIWLGEFNPNDKSTETIGVKSVVSLVGRVKLARD